VNWQKLFQTLQQIGVDYKDKLLIYNFYRRQIAEIRIEDKSATAKIRKGTRQECPMSPMLFNIYFEQPIKEIKETLNRKKIGVMVRGELIQMFRFTDDITLITKEEKEMETALEVF